MSELRALWSSARTAASQPFEHAYRVDALLRYSKSPERASTYPSPNKRVEAMKLTQFPLLIIAAISLGTAPISFAEDHAGHKTTAAASKDIVDTAVAAGSFTTLAAALNAADLVNTLKGTGPYTVFAPTDEAFKKLPAGTVENLLKPENKAKLSAILTYHVVSGNVKAADVIKLSEATTVQGGKVSIKAIDGKVLLNGNTTVTSADIAASNGTIHVVDTVLMPN